MLAIILSEKTYALAVRSGAMALIVFSLASTQVAAQQEQVDGDTDSPVESIEEVVVFGIHKSLETALAEKREKTNLTEIINAEDVGKLPDENVAEVLENIAGVQITRSAGIGASVSIRGSDQNRVEINGRGTTPSSDSRGGISFADLPAALVRSLNVVKVPTADMVEGSIGGTINVKTYRGLKLKKPLRVTRFSSEYAENADVWNENFSATLGNKFEKDYGDIGAILTISHIDKTVREDSLRVSPGIRRAVPLPGQGGVPVSNQEFDGDGDFNDPYYFPGFGDQVFGLEDRENTALSGSLEWQIHPEFKLFAEGSFTDFDQRGRNQSVLLGQPGSDKELDGLDDATWSLVTVAGIQVPIMTSGVIAGGIIDATGEPDGLQLRMGNRSSTRETESFVGALGGEWAQEQLAIEFEVTAAQSESRERSFSTVFQFNDPMGAANFHSANARVRIPFYFDARDGDLEYGPVQGAAGVENLLDPSYYSLFVARDIETNFDNSEYTQKVDFTFDTQTSFLPEFKFGVRTSQRSNKKTRQSQSTDIFPGFSGTQLSSFLTATPGNFFEFNSGGEYLDNFLTADAGEVVSRREELRGILGLDVGGIDDPLQGFRVEEKTYAMYFRGDFESEVFGMPLRGNAGYRYIRTDQLASGNEVLGSGELRAVAEHQVYSNLLPSFSLVLSPAEKIQLRFGYAEILRRPNFSQLSPTVAFPLNESQAVRVGDPSLRPTSAEQMDLTFEYYFRKGSAFSIGYFHKDLKGVIGEELRFDGICNPRAVGDADSIACVTNDGLSGVRVDRISPVNLPGGEIQGIELALQHKFNWLPAPYNGLGIIANYAYQDGERDDTFGVPGFLKDDGAADAEFPLNFKGLSENSYNLTIVFERPKSRLSGRLRYTYRDGFLVTESSDISNAQPLYTDDRGQLDGSMSYRVTDIVTLTFSGVNLSKEQTTQRAAFEGGPLVRQRDADRRYALGIRAKF